MKNKIQTCMYKLILKKMFSKEKNHEIFSGSPLARCGNLSNGVSLETSPAEAAKYAHDDDIDLIILQLIFQYVSTMYLKFDISQSLI